MSLRPLKEIAEEILEMWKDIPYPAKAYAEGLLELNTCKDMCGFEYGDMVTAHALDLICFKKGGRWEVIKKELQKHLDSFNNLN